MKSNLDLVNGCDRFPYYQDDAKAYNERVASYYKFIIDGCRSPLGYLLETTVNSISWPSFWTIDHQARLVILPAGKDLKHRNELMAKTLAEERDKKTFKVLTGWGDELYPIYGSNGELLLSMERAASGLFGIVTYGVHMITYVRCGSHFKFWVARRSRIKNAHPGMLDNSVGGSLSTGERPFDCLICEAEEEASFPMKLIKDHAKACGTLSYFQIRGEYAGGGMGLLEPQVQYVYEMEVGEEIMPTPGDDEVENFELFDLNHVKTALAEGKFKPNCALTMLDFFIRHGILQAEVEKDYIEIVSRIHRKLDFPTG